VSAEQWPKWLEQYAGLTQTLDGFIHDVKGVREREGNALSSAEIAAEARAIRRDAVKLKERFARLEAGLGSAAYDPPACVKEAERLHGGLRNGTLTDHERAWINAGLSAHYFARVVLPLSTYMDLIYWRYRARDGAPKKVAAAWAVGVLAIHLHDAGVDLGRRNSANIEAVCEVLFRRAGWPDEPTERTLRELTKARQNLIKGLW
jgi:hypothetical protein